MRRGITERRVVWRTRGAKRLSITTTRVASMKRRHCAAIRCQVTALDGPVTLRFESKVKAAVASEELGAGHTEVLAAACSGSAMSLDLQTCSSPSGEKGLFRIAAAVMQVTAGGTTVADGPFTGGQNDVFARNTTVTLEAGQSVTLDKFAAFYTSIEEAADRLVVLSEEETAAAARDGFGALVSEQEAFWNGYWEMADIGIDGNVADQQAVRFNLFHLRQSNPEDDRRSIGANGMTGDKYRGHVFWDTEMYLVPHFLYTEPSTVRSLLMYRYGLLDRARERAAQMQGTGALYSWNSITGEECGVVFEASTERSGR